MKHVTGVWNVNVQLDFTPWGSMAVYGIPNSSRIIKITKIASSSIIPTQKLVHTLTFWHYEKQLEFYLHT
jgi:hypothetical protein